VVAAQASHCPLAVIGTVIAAILSLEIVAVIAIVILVLTHIPS